MAYEFKCTEAGAMGCRWKARGNSEEEVMAKVEEHANKAHNVQIPTETIRNYLRSTIRRLLTGCSAAALFSCGSRRESALSTSSRCPRRPPRSRGHRDLTPHGLGVPAQK